MFKIIDSFEEACVYSAEGLLWWVWPGQYENWQPDLLAYWDRTESRSKRLWREEKTAGIQYGICVED